MPQPTPKPFALLAALALCLLLSGCWLPEHYLSRIKIERDGTYTLYAEGTAAHVKSLRALRRPATEAKGGAHKPADAKKNGGAAQDPLQRDLDGLKGDKRVLSVTPIGEGRVRFTLGGAWKLDTGLLIFREQQAPLSYAVGQDGTVRLRVKDAVATPEARALGVKTEGALSVVLAEGIEVLEHNAQKTPTTPRGAYRWEISGATDQAPYLKIRLPGAQPQGKPQGEGPHPAAHK